MFAQGRFGKLERGERAAILEYPPSIMEPLAVSEVARRKNVGEASALLWAAVLARTSPPSSRSSSRLSRKMSRSMSTGPAMIRLPLSSCVAFKRRIGRQRP
jgi:hypothetical protein